MIAANAAGIDVFVTGGIGGVHRNGQDTMDISADLNELGRTPVAVVSSGVKSILDIGRTLEFLETQGVTVVSYGPSDDFPSFYTRRSGFKAMANLETPEQCADLIFANRLLKLNSGMLIAVPIPEAAEFADPELLERVIQDAMKESSGISGKDITPFLLAKVKELTGGSSLDANISLVRNNALIGSQIAAALALKRTPLAVRPNHYIAKPLIIGGSVLDITAKVSSEVSDNEWRHTSSPGNITQTLGGVGRNIAESCHRAGVSPILVSAVADDLFGDAVRDGISKVGLDTSEIEVVTTGRTAVYNAVLEPSGEMVAAIADMDIHEQILASKDISALIAKYKPSIVCVDGNVSVEMLKKVADECRRTQTPLCFEPTSIQKCKKLLKLPMDMMSAFTLITPNRNELWTLSDGLHVDFPHLKHNEFHHRILKMLQVFSTVIVKSGADGVVIGLRSNKQMRLSEETTIKFHHFFEKGTHYTLIHLHPQMKHDKVVSVTGAGDTFAGIMLAAFAKIYARDAKPDEANLIRSCYDYNFI